jgi:hypothetical protein
MDMNFEELQNKWNQQTGDAVNIRTESLKKTRSITDKISKNFKREFVFSSKENLIQLYYELKFAVESYKISCYIIVPSALGLYFVIFGKNRTFEWFMKYVNLRETLAIDPGFIWKTSIIGILLLAFILLFCEWTIDKYYGKYLQQIKLLLKNFEE